MKPRAAACLLAVASLLVITACTSEQSTDTPEPASSSTASTTSAASSPSASTPSPSDSETTLPPAKVEVKGSGRASSKQEKEGVKTAKAFLTAFSTSFANGEVETDIRLYAPTLVGPMEKALKQDKKNDVTYAGTTTYTLTGVSADEASATVQVCGDWTEAFTVTDGAAKPTEKKPVSQEVRMTIGATPEYRGFMVEELATVDDDYC